MLLLLKSFLFTASPGCRATEALAAAIATEFDRLQPQELCNLRSICSRFPGLPVSPTREELQVFFFTLVEKLMMISRTDKIPQAGAASCTHCGNRASEQHDAYLRNIRHNAGSPREAGDALNMRTYDSLPGVGVCNAHKVISTNSCLPRVGSESPKADVGKKTEPHIVTDGNDTQSPQGTVDEVNL